MNNGIGKIVRNYYKENFSKKKFIPGVSAVPVSGKVFDEDELINGIDAVFDGWWTEGRFAKDFEKNFSKYLGVRYVTLVNSGSSANLVALSALTSEILKERSLRPGDEIITTALGFPTTINPIIQNKCIPVFVDIDVDTINALPAQIERAISSKTKAIILAHTLGNPFNLKDILKIVKKYNLWLIEDCCDALGSTYNNKLAGTFGDIATFSFYPAHQITMGEGGAIITNNPLLHRSIRQFRDWGRDCWCDTGRDDTCGKRFVWKIGDLPLGYDHKYIYSQIGYNLKLTDFQAAIGVAQLKKLPQFIKQRKVNYQKLHKELKKYNKYFILPEKDKKADPCWFGFMIVIRNNAPFSRLKIISFLESKKIATRNLFAGNILKHPGYKNIKKRVIGNLKNSDIIMNNGFWIGVYPGINNEMIKYILTQFEEFFSQYE